VLTFGSDNYRSRNSQRPDSYRDSIKELFWECKGIKINYSGNKFFKKIFSLQFEHFKDTTIEAYQAVKYFLLSFSGLEVTNLVISLLQQTKE